MIRGTRAIVTGASRGIGFSIAKRLVEQGLTVVITGRNPHSLAEAQKALGAHAIPLVWDASDVCLADEKIEEAEYLKNFGALIYVGDGMNDAPVMAAADCSISLGKLGSAAAVQASDIVLVSDDLRGIISCMKIAKKTRNIVRQNIVFAIVMKAVCMLLGVIGVLPLALAVFADVGVMLVAVCNSLRARKI